MISSVTVLRAARREAQERGMPDTFQALAFVLAGWCAALLATQSSGFVRRGLPRVAPGGDAVDPNPTLLDGER